MLSILEVTIILVDKGSSQSFTRFSKLHGPWALGYIHEVPHGHTQYNLLQNTHREISVVNEDSFPDTDIPVQNIYRESWDL